MKKLLILLIIFYSYKAFCFQDFYRFLNVQPNATDAEIKASFRKLASKYHPDKSATKSPIEIKNAENIFKEIKKAKETLLDPTKRRAFDNQRTIHLGKVSKNNKGFKHKTHKQHTTYKQSPPPQRKSTTYKNQANAVKFTKDDLLADFVKKFYRTKDLTTSGFTEFVKELQSKAQKLKNHPIYLQAIDGFISKNLKSFLKQNPSKAEIQSVQKAIFDKNKKNFFYKSILESSKTKGDFLRRIEMIMGDTTKEQRGNWLKKHGAVIDVTKTKFYPPRSNIDIIFRDINVLNSNTVQATTSTDNRSSGSKQTKEESTKKPQKENYKKSKKNPRANKVCSPAGIKEKMKTYLENEFGATTKGDFVNELL